MQHAVEIRHGHLFCGLGGGAAGFNDAQPVVGSQVGRFRCLGGIDSDPAAIADFGRLAGMPGTLMDLFSRQQHIHFHGQEPPAGWREAMPADIHRAFGYERPHIVFLSPPCKGFSGLMSEGKSKTLKYVALNELTLRGLWLLLEAYADDPVELILLENVPRIASRGRHLLDQMTALLRRYGYIVRETTHDCGEIGELPESRKRFLMVARHAEKVPPFLYEPPKRPLRAVGEWLGRMPLPGDERGGPMHRVPALQWKTWVRLAFVEAGKDWRSLNRLAVENGHLRDYLIVPEMHHGVLGVQRWGEPSGVVAGASRPGNGAFSVADPRAAEAAAQYQQYGVLRWGEHSGAIIGVKSPGQGTFSVSDPRCPSTKHNNCFRVVRMGEPAGTVTGGGHPSAGGQAVADPRQPGPLFSKYPVTGWGEPSGTVISGSTTGQGAFAVADPRPGLRREAGDHYLTGGHFGVVPWEAPSGAVSAAACHDNGRWSVADPRLPELRDQLVAVIRAEDGTWHRPFTTLELAVIQSLVEPEEQLELDGLSDQAWRERIGNAVPRKTAKAVGEELGRTLMLAWSGESFQLSATPIWVRNVAVAMSLEGGV